VTEAGGKYSGLDGDETPKPGVALFPASAQLHAGALERLSPGIHRRTLIDCGAPDAQMPFYLGR